MADDERLATFLIVHDDPADDVITRDSFEAYGVVNRVWSVRTADAAMAYLRASFRSSDRGPVPDMILLDLNLPGRDGRHLLRLLRADPVTMGLPVVLLVDSPVAEHILRAERLPVQGYATRPFDFHSLVAMVRRHDDLGFLVKRA